MYLLVDWYTLCIGADREWGVFVSLYGPGTSNGCHMAKQTGREGGKKTCTDLGWFEWKRRGNGRNKSICKKRKTEQIFFFFHDICMRSRSSSALTLFSIDSLCFIAFFQGHCCCMQHSTRRLHCISRERWLYSFSRPLFPAPSPLSLFHFPALIARSTQQGGSRHAALLRYASSCLCIWLSIYDLLFFSHLTENENSATFNVFYDVFYCPA